MRDNLKDVDVEALPVHLFIKSPKEAKKVKKDAGAVSLKPGPYIKAKRFDPRIIH
jgi:hypothetical protein